MAILTPRDTEAEIRQIYLFGQNTSYTTIGKEILGGKGNGLMDMCSIGLPVPPGFIISTVACNEYRQLHRNFQEKLKEEIFSAMHWIEKQIGRKFGDAETPLLVSVRSGARASMPGMMDTILDLGLNDQAVIGFANMMRNPKLAYDNYRRFIEMFGNIAKGIDKRHFDEALAVLKMGEQVSNDSSLSLEGHQKACQIFKTIYQEHTQTPFPQDVKEQLIMAISSVFNSWDNERAILYRQLNHIPDSWGTAVIVQAMVFGNRNDRSATGVGFTRDPRTGNKQFFGEFLPNAQGEEVVAGIQTPFPLNLQQKKANGSSFPSLEEMMPHVYEELLQIVTKLENFYKDMQDIEFTIDDGKLYMLQTRTGKRTGFAALKMAVDMLQEGLIDEKTALKRVSSEQLTQILAPIFDQKAKNLAKSKLAAKGLNAGPGAASGKAAFSVEKALFYKREGIHSILIREETNPNDFPGMVAANGILTLRGGSTSHAAVVARGMGKPCIVGCEELKLYTETKTIIGRHGLTIKEGDDISIDGMTGEVYFSDLPTSPSEVVQVLIDKTIEPEKSVIFQQFRFLMNLTDKYRKLEVRTNADTPYDNLVARSFGAEGTGLCRTEHMFMHPKRLNDVRCLFFSTDQNTRKNAVSRLLPYQKQDFVEIFKVMDGLPVTIRLLDPPLHEFMPQSDAELDALADIMHVSKENLASIRTQIAEHNPMLGHRGCRLGVTYPELTEMQTRAIVEAALVAKKAGVDVELEIMIPLIFTENEFLHQKKIIDLTAEKIFEEYGEKIAYHVGTMIELPRAALLADKIAKYAEFFSFGTNDLTQTTLGISRDDYGKFINFYVAGIPTPGNPEALFHILPHDPFQTIDQEGVGKLMQLAIQLGKEVRPNLICGVCGEHGGDAASIEFFNCLGLNYVSCSPYRVPIAKLAAAQAAVG